MSAQNLKFPEDAACAKAYLEDPEWRGAWDGPNEDGEKHPLHYAAIEVCRHKCQVQFACLQDALLDPEAQGVRDGYVFDGGKLPVAKAREIRDTTGLRIGTHQSLGRTRR